MGPISGGEFVVLLVLAAIVLGPERLPQYAQQLGRLVRELRRMARGASAQVRDELGPEFDDIDWKKLDPRQYDPRKIVREALADDDWDDEDPFGLKSLADDADWVLREGSDSAAAPDAGYGDEPPGPGPDGERDVSPDPQRRGGQGRPGTGRQGAGRQGAGRARQPAADGVSDDIT